MDNLDRIRILSSVACTARPPADVSWKHLIALQGEGLLVRRGATATLTPAGKAELEAVGREALTQEVTP